MATIVDRAHRFAYKLPSEISAAGNYLTQKGVAGGLSGVISQAHNLYGSIGNEAQSAYQGAMSGLSDMEQKNLDSHLHQYTDQADLAYRYGHQKFQQAQESRHVQAIDEGIHMAAAGWTALDNTGFLNGGLEIGLNSDTLSAGLGIAHLVGGLYNVGKAAYEGLSQWWHDLTN